MSATEKANRIKKVLILVVILLLPGFFYFFLKEKGTNLYVHLPYYGNKVFGSDTSWHRVPSVSLLDEYNAIQRVPSADTTVSVVNFFYTKCPSFCLRMNETVYRLALRFSKSEMIRFYSISVDPKDDFETLKTYSQHWTEGAKNWHFYSSGQINIKELSQNSYFLNAVCDTAASDVIIISPKLVLLDSKQRIRGYYDSTNDKEIDRLTDEIRVLIAEERRQKSNHDIR